jgi:hypothetical protein
VIGILEDEDDDEHEDDSSNSEFRLKQIPFASPFGIPRFAIVVQP